MVLVLVQVQKQKTDVPAQGQSCREREKKNVFLIQLLMISRPSVVWVRPTRSMRTIALLSLQMLITSRNTRRNNISPNIWAPHGPT